MTLTHAEGRPLGRLSAGDYRLVGLVGQPRVVRRPDGWWDVLSADGSRACYPFATRRAAINHITQYRKEIP